MRWRLETSLFCAAIGLVVAAFMLAWTGARASPESPELHGTLLAWQEVVGLLMLVVLAAALVARYCSKRSRPMPLPDWLPLIRREVVLLLYLLVALQPFSGWLLASNDGKLLTVFRWVLPSLTSPSPVVTQFGLYYHGLNGGLILLIALLSFRLRLTASLFAGLGRAVKDCYIARRAPADDRRSGD